MHYLKQESKQSYTRHIMFCLCQRAVRLLDVDYMQLETQNITNEKKIAVLVEGILYNSALFYTHLC